MILNREIDQSVFIPQTITSSTYIFKFIYLNVENKALTIYHSACLCHFCISWLVVNYFTTVVLSLLLTTYRERARAIDQHMWTVVDNDSVLKCTVCASAKSCNIANMTSAKVSEAQSTEHFDSVPAIFTSCLSQVDPAMTTSSQHQ